MYMMFICNEIAVDRLFVSDVYDCGRLLVICFYRYYLCELIMFVGSIMLVK